MEPKKPNFLTLVQGGLSEQLPAAEAELLAQTVMKIAKAAGKEPVPIHHLDAATVAELLEE